AIRYSKTEFLSEVNDFKVCLKELVLTFRSCATETYEPCQIRKEAAVSRFFCVPRDSLDRAMNLSNAWDYFIDDRCTVTYKKRSNRIVYLRRLLLLILLRKSSKY